MPTAPDATSTGSRHTVRRVRPADVDAVVGIHLEDLYVSPTRRRGGVGLALLAELAAECTSRGFSRLEWSVLDRNTPALDFYAAIGAVGMDGWTVHRLTGDPLAALASRRP